MSKNGIKTMYITSDCVKGDFTVIMSVSYVHCETLILFLKSDQLHFVLTALINCWEKSMVLPGINEMFTKKKKNGLLLKFCYKVFKEKYMNEKISLENYLWILMDY